MLVNERNRASGTNAGVSVKGKGSELVKYNLATAITITILLVLVTFPGASSGTPRKIGPGYDIEMSRMIPLRDGVQLEAWIFKPSGLQSKAPTVLCLTQYEINGRTPGQIPS